MHEKLLYFDMEWVPIQPTLKDLEENEPLLFSAFSNRLDKYKRDEKYKDLSDEEIWERESSFTAEYSKIICVSFGYWKNNEKALKTISGYNEKLLLEDVRKILINAVNSNHILCGYAIKRWDLPWLAKRMVANKIALPSIINFNNKKPWEINVYDIPEIWSFGCNQEKYTPFEVLCVTMGIPTPKDDIGGADVKRVYWEENDLERIARYCEKDVDKTMDLQIELEKWL